MERQSGYSPGRFFTIMELKLVLAYMVRKYDFKLATDEGGVRPRNKFFGFSCAPDSEVQLLFKVRDGRD